MELRNKVAGALMGVALKGLQNAKETAHELAVSVQQNDLCWENMIGWLLAGFLGAMGATLFNLFYKKTFKKRFNAKDQNISV